jgi:hypothetical protein
MVLTWVPIHPRPNFRYENGETDGLTGGFLWKFVAQCLWMSHLKRSHNRFAMDGAQVCACQVM